MIVGDRIGVNWGGTYIFIGDVESFCADDLPVIRTPDNRLKCTLPGDTFKPVYRWHKIKGLTGHV